VVVAQVRTAVRTVAVPVRLALLAVVLHDEVLPDPRYPDLLADPDLLGVAGECDRVAERTLPTGATVDHRVGDAVARRGVVPPAVERQERRLRGRGLREGATEQAGGGRYQDDSRSCHSRGENAPFHGASRSLDART